MTLQLGTRLGRRNTRHRTTHESVDRFLKYFRVTLISCCGFGTVSSRRFSLRPLMHAHGQYYFVTRFYIFLRLVLNERSRLAHSQGFHNAGAGAVTMTLFRPCATVAKAGRIFQHSLGFSLHLRRHKTSFSSPISKMVAQPIPTGERLRKLRELMQKEGNNVNAYLVPSEDQRESFERDDQGRSIQHRYT